MGLMLQFQMVIGSCFVLSAYALVSSTTKTTTTRAPSSVLLRGGENKQFSRSETTLCAHPSGRRSFLKSGVVSSSAAVLTGLGIPLEQHDAALAFDLPGNTNFNNLSRKIRKVCVIMDELQRDLMQERWDLVEQYPPQLRSYVPVFTAYTDESFASDDVPSNKGLRVALRYEVGRFYGSVERLKQASGRKDLNEAYLAYASMAIHFDRYLRAGNLYTYVDPLVSTESLFEKIPDQSLVYANPKTDPPEIRDLVVLTQGPDKGKTGIVIGIFPDTKNVVVKLDRYQKVGPIREIKVVNPAWAGKRLGEQDPDDVFLIPRKEKRSRETSGMV
eukprot:CAMPEP_0116012518 /NCGR_PEP_ID=MMETSP0321-20121206/5169_1 /TAXON_ID=163516 /ORGANISM="Leptocylindrus danicus var. danicus, Strain B650" /LENGTH=329 /DNA_ID=CAMNT_0003481873 /DNA_START=27 /DNA_END=1016 /DNA_ORIENTATION=-